MAIQFQCSCGNTLRVSDEHAGKAARCPDCKTVNQIPKMENVFAGPIAESPPKQKALPDNPYAPGRASIGRRPKSGAIQPTKVSFDQILSVAWDLWKDNLGLLVSVTVTVFVVSLLFDTALRALEDNPIGIVVALASSVCQLLLGIGQVRISCDLARGTTSSYERLFSGGDKILPIIGTSILFGLGFAFGFLLLVIPGIVFAILCWSYFYFVADNKSGALESFSVAYQCGSINIGTTLLVWLTSLAIIIVGFLALCIGIIFAAPLASMMWAVFYLKMSGQIR